MKNAFDFFAAKPARFFLLAALLWSGLMCFLNYRDGVNFQWHDLLVEANGMVFDLLVFGVLLSIYDGIRAKRERIDRYLQEIDDFRDWKEQEATYRITGLIRRLNKEGVSKINLKNCHLSKAKLHGVNLNGADIGKRKSDDMGNFMLDMLAGTIFDTTDLTNATLNLANLNRANLRGVDLTRAQLVDTSLIEADLSETNLTDAILNNANLIKANLSEANLENATLFRAFLCGANLNMANLHGTKFIESDLRKANLSNTNLADTILTLSNLSNTDLENAIVSEDWFDKIKKWGVIGIDEIIENYFLDDTDEEFTLKRKASL
jgi:uncharacterized protein YjbI with pentapeptide repeats